MPDPLLDVELGHDTTNDPVEPVNGPVIVYSVSVFDVGLTVPSTVSPNFTCIVASDAVGPPNVLAVMVILFMLEHLTLGEVIDSELPRSAQ